MSKINCNIITDLLPLYIDEVVSDDGKKAVEEHMNECEECRKRYEMMRKEITIDYGDETSSLKKIKRDINNDKKRIAVISVLCTIAVIAALLVITGRLHQTEKTDTIFGLIGLSGLLIMFGIVIYTRRREN